MIKHIVFLKFKPQTSGSAIEDLEKSLNQLQQSIPEIKDFQCGRDVIGSERSYDFGLVVDFEDLAAGERYQKHPEHLKVIDKIKAICNDIKAVDFEF